MFHIDLSVLIIALKLKIMQAFFYLYIKNICFSSRFFVTLTLRVEITSVRENKQIAPSGLAFVLIMAY